ncbi:MAG: extracellular solute-binding protein, partial [Pseudomonadota bacterium]
RTVFASFVLIVSTALAQGASLTLSCLDVGRAVAACREAAARFADETGNTVRVVSANPAGREALENYRALLAVRSTRLDVIQFPDAWAPALAPDLLPLPIGDNADDFIAAATQGARVEGIGVGLPHHLAIMVMLLRSDVVGDGVNLWSQLRERLLTAPGDGASGLAFGAAEPALFPFFLDWVYGLGGTDLADRQSVRVALAMLGDLIGPVAVPGITRARAGDAIDGFVEGRNAALVARSTRAAAVDRDELEATVFATLPQVDGGPETAPVLATVWFLGVPRSSAAPEEARALARFLASEDAQRSAAVNFGLAPTRHALFDEEAVRGAGPILAEIATVKEAITAAPVERYGLAYLDLSDQVSEVVRELLRGERDAETATSAILRAVRRAERQEN